jgi:hypothetical protein
MQASAPWAQQCCCSCTYSAAATSASQSSQARVQGFSNGAFASQLSCKDAWDSVKVCMQQAHGMRGDCCCYVCRMESRRFLPCSNRLLHSQHQQPSQLLPFSTPYQLLQTWSRWGTGWPAASSRAVLASFHAVLHCALFMHR